MTSRHKPRQTKIALIIASLLFVGGVALFVWRLGVDPNGSADADRPAPSTSPAPSALPEARSALPALAQPPPIRPEPSSAGRGRLVGRAVNSGAVNSGAVNSGAVNSGAVNSGSGAALPGAEATAGASDGGGRDRRSSPVGTSPGRFAVEGLRAGEYRVTVRAPGYLPRVLEGVRIASSDDHDLGDVALSKGSYVKGTVFDKTTGAPVAGAVVSAGGIAEDGAGTAPRAHTDERGAFVLGPYPAGPRPVRITRRGYHVVQLPHVALSEGDGAVLGPLFLTPRATRASDGECAASPGLALRHEPGRVSVRRVAPGSPAADAGLTEGWIIESIDGYPASDLSPGDAGALLCGPAGSDVGLTMTDNLANRERFVRLERR